MSALPAAARGLRTAPADGRVCWGVGRAWSMGASGRRACALERERGGVRVLAGGGVGSTRSSRRRSGRPGLALLQDTRGHVRSCRHRPARGFWSGRGPSPPPPCKPLASFILPIALARLKLLFPLLRRGDRGTERVKSLPRATRTAGGRAGLRLRASQAPGPSSQARFLWVRSLVSQVRMTRVPVSAKDAWVQPGPWDSTLQGWGAGACPFHWYPMWFRTSQSLKIHVLNEGTRCS